MIKMNRNIYLVFLLQLTFILFGRSENAHELLQLKKQLASSKKDTGRVRLLNSISIFYYYDDRFDSSRFYAAKAREIADSLLGLDQVQPDPQYTHKCNALLAMAIRNTALTHELDNSAMALDSLQLALKIALPTNDKNVIATIYQSIGWIYEYQNETKLALEHYQLAKSIFEETGNKKKLGYLMALIGINQRYSGNYGDAIESQMQALQIGKELKDSLTIKEALLALGFTYLKVEKWKEAFAYQKQGLGLLIRMNDSSGIARAYNDLGVTHMSMDSLDAAIKDHLAALKIRIKIDDTYSIASSYFYLGSIYQKQGHLPEALESYSQSHIYSVKSGSVYNIIDSQIEIGTVYHEMGNTKLALENFYEALNYSHEKKQWIGTYEASKAIGGIKLDEGKNADAINWFEQAIAASPKDQFGYLSSVYKKLSEAYINEGNYKKGYENFEIYHQMKDSLRIAENDSKITTLTSRLEFENKQTLLNEQHAKEMQLKQAEIKRQKITRNFSLFGMGAILILAIIFFIRFIEKNKMNDKLQRTLSNLKDTQSQLIHAEKMASLGELTAGIAHEIQNPLNFVNNFSEVSAELLQYLTEEIQNGNKEEIDALTEDLKHNLEKINTHGKRASSIVNGMLGHSRKGSGKKELTDINVLADEYLRLSYHGLRAKDKTFNADFKAELDRSIPKIPVVAQDIGRVFLNLINNAFYACTERSRSASASGTLAKADPGYKPIVVVSTKKLDDQIVIVVKDNGNGIPADVKEKIFQPFFTTKPSGKGTGLGLSLSYDIITKGHGGTFDFETKVGEGTKFVIKLKI